MQNRLKIHQRWECICGFEFEIEDSNPACPFEQIKEIVLAKHKGAKHKLTHFDFQKEASLS